MAGPYTGTWRRDSVSSAKYTGALKQGTGINPVHWSRDNGPDLLIPKQVYETPDDGPGDDPSGIIEYDSEFYENPRITDEDTELSAQGDFWGNNSETGLRDHPDYQEVGDANTAGSRAALNQPDWPPWGGSRKTQPAGNFIRSLLHGALATNRTRQVPIETVGEGWLNKPKGEPADSIDSDPSQLVMNASSTQRYMTRAGSQSTGRASEYDAPIKSRVVGQKVKVYSGEDRHWDMTPYSQDDIIRPFLSRQAGIGYPQWQLPNEMYISKPRQREPSPDPFQGDVTPPETSLIGYTMEDQQYYA